MKQWTAGALIVLIVFTSSLPAHAWSEGGHHLIAALAFNLLSKDEQAKLLSTLSKHPRFKDDFKTPKNLSDAKDIGLWQIGRASYWPDVARRQPAYNRSTWHYELGPSKTVGTFAEAIVPSHPGPLPTGATLETQDLHIAQAIELCISVMKDTNQSETDRAIALCWIGHLVADAHQPCHAGSLYMAGVFETNEGDRGGNSIPTKQRRNLHSLWDGLLGDNWSAGGARRRSTEIMRNQELIMLGQDAALSLDPKVWLKESRAEAVEHVYTSEIMDELFKVQRGLLQEPEKIVLTEEYLKNAGRIAQRRAVQAAYRLAESWKGSVAK
jgi:hypothetical protein